MSESRANDKKQQANQIQAAKEQKLANEEMKKKKLQQRRAKLMPFFKFLKKNGLKFKTARCQKQRIQYFRVDALEALLLNHKQELDKDQKLRNISRNWQKMFIFFNRPQNLPHMKYPQVLDRSPENQLAKFASFKFDTSQSKKWMFPLILVGVIAAVLFPLWPYSLKYAVWLIALYLLCAIVGLIILRLVVYMFCAIFGISFWILPNFFGDYGFVQSFFPIYSLSKWQIGAFNLIARLLALTIFGYYAYHLYVDSSWLFENLQITKTSIDDLHDWGVSKIKGQKNFSQSALTNMETIMNQTADAHQQIDLDEQKLQNSNENQVQSEVQEGRTTLQVENIENNQDNESEQEQFDANDPGL